MEKNNLVKRINVSVNNLGEIIKLLEDNNFQKVISKKMVEKLKESFICYLKSYNLDGSGNNVDVIELEGIEYTIMENINLLLHVNYYKTEKLEYIVPQLPRYINNDYHILQLKVLMKEYDNLNIINLLK